MNADEWQQKFLGKILDNLDWTKAHCSGETWERLFGLPWDDFSFLMDYSPMSDNLFCIKKDYRERIKSRKTSST